MRAPAEVRRVDESWTYYQAVAFLAYGDAEIAARYGGPRNAHDGGKSQRFRDVLYPAASGLPGFEAAAAEPDPAKREVALYGAEAEALRWPNGLRPAGPVAVVDCGTITLREANGQVAADAIRWASGEARLYEAMLHGSATAYRGTAAYSLTGLINPVAAAVWVRGLSGAEACRFLPAEVTALAAAPQPTAPATDGAPDRTASQTNRATTRTIPRHDYRAADVLLSDEMRQLITEGRARGVTDAARAVCARAQGRGNAATKVKRLIGAYGRQFGATCPHVETSGQDHDERDD
jgi:hypothetical protein